VQVTIRTLITCAGISLLAYFISEKMHADYTLLSFFGKEAPFMKQVHAQCPWQIQE
jgi:hypothetical protein